MTIVQITSDPRWGKATPEQRKKLLSMADDAPPNLKQAFSDSFSNLTTGMASRAKDLGTNPVTMAKAIPYATQAGMSFVGGPFAGTRGYAGGRALSSVALKALGHPEEIPPAFEMDQKFPYVHGYVPEAATAVLGDLTAVPAVNKKMYGAEVGQYEKAAGFPEAKDVRSIPMSLGQKSVGDFINDAMDSVSTSGGKGTPSYWMQLKDQVDRIYKLGKDQGLTTLDQGRLKALNRIVQAGMNTEAPGRSVPAMALATSQKVPNAIQDAFDVMPKSLRYGLGVGAGSVGGGGLAYALGKKLAQRGE